MSQRDPDLRIDDWLREELDAVPEPTRALSMALDAAAVTPQRRGRLFRLRELLGYEPATVALGSARHPEVVLTPGSPAQVQAGSLPQRRALAATPLLSATVGALAVLGVVAWLAFGAGGPLHEAGPAAVGTVTPEQPMRPLDAPGPGRVIMVDADRGHFATIGGAVSAARSGDRIEIHPGTYEAEVAITEDIALVGVGARETIVVRAPSAGPDEGSPDQQRLIFTLLESDATLQGFTVRGAFNGTAIKVVGGSPQLLDLSIDPEGEMDAGSPTTPRESLELGGGSTATVRDTQMTSLSSVIEGAAPLLERVTFEQGCLLVEGAGTAPTVRDATFRDSGCPGFSISVAQGASATLTANHIYSPPDQSGIRVANEGTQVSVSGTDITGGREGILATAGAEIDVKRSQVDEAEIGVRIVDADASLQLNRLERNRTGLQVSGDSYLETLDNDICDNDRNLDLRDGALVPRSQNRVCAEGDAGAAVENGD